jgi:hypothetical protein
VLLTDSEVIDAAPALYLHLAHQLPLLLGTVHRLVICRVRFMA